MQEEERGKLWRSDLTLLVKGWRGNAEMRGKEERRGNEGMCVLTLLRGLKGNLERRERENKG